MNIKNLIDVLKTKEPKDEINFLVVRKDGSIVCMMLQGKNADITKIHELFEAPSNSKADVPEGFVFCDKYIIPERVIAAGERFLDEFPYKGIAHNLLALAIHTEMLNAYNSLIPIKDDLL